MWVKLVRNVGDAPSAALTGGTIEDIHFDNEVLEIVKGTMREVIAVARAEGFEDLGFDLSLEGSELRRIPHNPSLLQDLEAGRRLELETLFYALREIASSHRVATPILDLLVPLLRLKSEIHAKRSR
jgi:2-dehydropantoate 2-reductase